MPTNITPRTDPATGDIATGDVTVVLLVDDQAIVGYAVKQMLLTETDIHLHFCQDPSKAIAMANEVLPSVILQDLVMPEIDGLTLLKFFRANRSTRETPMIVLSSKEEPTTKAQAFALGANDYLVKLPDRIELIARIRHHSRGYIALLQRNEAYRKLAESERKLAEEVGQAAMYVRSLLPAPLTNGPVRIDWRFVPSTQLAGDAFGYRWLDEKNLAIYLLDVSGHGVGSALLAVSVLNVLSHGSLPSTDFSNPGAVMTGLNTIFQMEHHGSKFFTIWYGVFQTDSRQLTFSGGGHPPALLAGPSTGDARVFHEIETPGPPIGVASALPFDNATTDIPPARLLLYSDGAVEIDQPDGTMGTQSSFTESVNAFSPRDDLMESVLKRARATRGDDGLNDDCSLLQIDF